MKHGGHARYVLVFMAHMTLHYLSRLLKDVEYKHLITNIKIDSHSTALKFHIICGVIIIIRDIPAFQSTTIL